MSLSIYREAKKEEGSVLNILPVLFSETSHLHNIGSVRTAFQHSLSELVNKKWPASEYIENCPKTQRIDNRYTPL